MNLTDDLKKKIKNHKYVDRIASFSPNYRKKGARSNISQVDGSISQFDMDSKTMYSTF